MNSSWDINGCCGRKKINSLQLSGVENFNQIVISWFPDCFRQFHAKDKMIFSFTAIPLSFELEIAIEVRNLALAAKGKKSVNCNF